MLIKVKTPTRKLAAYKGFISRELLREINELAKDLRGLKVTIINSTPRGGGVAEILKSLVPLLKGVGLNAEWYVIPFDDAFFHFTKELHNALQGKKYRLSNASKNLYLRHLKKTAKLMEDMRSDIWIIHDSQPLGIIDHLKGSSPKIAHIHIDTSHPNMKTWDFIQGFLVRYDKVVFSAKEFTTNFIHKKKLVIFPPAIDPLSPKNKKMTNEEAKLNLENLGINTRQPLISQISRFDPWKDPLGVIKVYRLAKKKIPGLQLILVGLFLAVDDPEAVEIYKQVVKIKAKDPDIFLFSSPEQIGGLTVSEFVSSCQVGSDVILQKSIKEGFGLTVAEAMWKEKAVVGGKVGGIKQQITHGRNGFLVSNPKEAAQRIIELLENRELREKFGKAARKTVRKKFLMPRMLRDYLKLLKSARKV